MVHPADTAVELRFEAPKAAPQLIRFWAAADTFLLVVLEPMYESEEGITVNASTGFDAAPVGLNATPLSRAELVEHAPVTLAQAIAQVPGVTFFNTGVGISKPVIRGQAFNRVQTRFEGVPIRDQAWGSDHGLALDPYATAGAQVVRGPGALAYGADAIAGAVLLQAPEALATEGHELAATAQYRSVNQAQLLTAGYRTRSGRWFGHARVTAQRFADFRVPATDFLYNRFVLPIFDERLKNTAGRELHLGGGIGYDGTGFQVQAVYRRFYQEVGLFSGAIGIPRAYDLQPDGDPYDIGLPSMTIAHDLGILTGELNLGTGTLSATVAHQRNLRDEFSAPHVHGSDSLIATSDLAHQLNLSTTTARIGFAQPIRRTLTWTTQAMAEWQRHRIDGFEFLLSPYDRDWYGLSSQLEWRITPTLRAEVGLRYDWATTDIAPYSEPTFDSQGNPNGVWERVPATSRQWGNPSAALGLHWQATEHWQVKLHGGSAFRFPQPIELAANGVHHGTFRHERGDPTLDAERGWQADFSLNGRFRTFRISFTPFAAHYQDYIYLAPSAEFSTLPEGGQLYHFTQADARFWGAELALGWRPIPRLSLTADAAVVNSRNLETDLPIAFQPPMEANAAITYTQPLPGLTWADGLRFRLDAQAVADQTNVVRNELETPGYGLLHAQLRLPMHFGGRNGTATGWRLEPFVVVRNLLNRHYLRHLSRYRQLNLPEPGRNVVLGVSIRV